MTFEELRSFIEKRNRHAAILDTDFKILWDKDSFFNSRTNIKWPEKSDFYNKKEVIFSIGAGNEKIPVSMFKITLSGGEARYVCVAFDNDFVSELASNSVISELLKNYLSSINDKIHTIQFLADQSIKNPLVQSDEALLVSYKNQSAAALDLLALSTNLNYYFNTFSYSESESSIDIFKIISGLIKKCNELLGSAAIVLTSKESDRLIKISERVFTVIFLNLIQNALAYCKPDSKINVKIFFESENAVISVTNEIEAGVSDSEISENVRLGIGIPLVERVASSVGGSFFTERAGGTYKAHITLPLYEKSPAEEAVFKSRSAEFITQNTSYVKRYLNRFIEK